MLPLFFKRGKGRPFVVYSFGRMLYNLGAMRILFVVESANLVTNGTAATCYRFAAELRKRGHEVLIMGAHYDERANEPEWYIGLEHYKFPIFDGLIRKEGFIFCKIDDATLYRTIKTVDLVHTMLPFKLHNVCRLIADSLGIPVTGAYHLMPQNVSSAIHMGKWRFLNNCIYRGFRTYLYNQIRHIHCPSAMIEAQMRKHHYTRNVTHVISNGVNDYFHPVPAQKPAEWGSKIVITAVGRLAREKRQDLLIKAVAKSKHNKDIQILLCGKGPLENHYRKLADKVGLANPLVIRFCGQEELREILSYSDIYVHASDFEVEGISCIEAFACGALPIIGDSQTSATPGFALDNSCLFKHGSKKDLCERIDYFIEHEDERKKLSASYIEHAKEYALPLMAKKLEAMFLTAVEEEKKGDTLPLRKPRKKDIRKARRIFKKLIKDGICEEMPARLR